MKSIIQSLIYGMFCAIAALLLQFTLSIFLIDFTRPEDFLLIQNSALFIFAAVLSEEFSKFIFTYKVIKSFSISGSDLIANSFIAGIGFSAIELTLFIYKYETITQVDFSEIVKVTLLHILTFGIIGYISSFPKKPLTIFTQAIIVTTGLHFAFNFSNIKEGILFEYTSVGIILLLILLNIYNLSTIKNRLANSQ
ncbi:hypothetical protein ACFL08_00370 [Patescibacteria group bacterium]